MQLSSLVILSYITPLIVAAPRLPTPIPDQQQQLLPYFASFDENEPTFDTFVQSDSCNIESTTQNTKRTPTPLDHPDLPTNDDINRSPVPCLDHPGGPGYPAAKSIIGNVRSWRFKHWPHAHDGTQFQCALFYRNLLCAASMQEMLAQKPWVILRYADKDRCVKGTPGVEGELLSVGFSTHEADCRGQGENGVGQLIMPTVAQAAGRGRAFTKLKSGRGGAAGAEAGTLRSIERRL